MKNATQLCNTVSKKHKSDYDDFIDASEHDVKEYLPQVETLVKKIISLINAKD
jgi:hypothetical protein